MHGTGRRWARPHGTGLSPRCAKSTPSLSLRLAAIPAKDSHACCTPWSVFQDGSNGSLSKASAHGTHCDRTPAYLQPCAANTAGSPGHDGAAHRRRPALRARAAKAKGRHSPRSAASSAPRGQHRGRRGPGQLPTRNTNPTHQTGADPAPAPLQQVPGGPNPGGSIPPGGQSNSHQSGPTATPVGTGTPQRPMGFPSSGFTHCLTLFSKCFSPFPHGTCLLSVSHQYSALDGVYHPLWAALPNNPTLRGGLTQAARRGPRRRGYHPLRRALPRRL